MNKTLCAWVLAMLAGLAITGCSSVQSPGGPFGGTAFGGACTPGFALARSGGGLPGCGTELEALGAAGALAGLVRDCDVLHTICSTTGTSDPNLGASDPDRDTRLPATGNARVSFCKPDEVPELTGCLCPQGVARSPAVKGIRCEKESQAQQIERERKQVIAGMRLLNERFKLGLLITNAPKP